VIYYYARDNSILCYSVDSACLLSRLQASHDDSVSCMALSQNFQQQQQQAQSSTADNATAVTTARTATTSRLITGAFDATVKVLSTSNINAFMYPTADVTCAANAYVV
jgi:hypothetical protein